MKKQNKGITLIALVITIIVLLILAGVSIATLTGENGILTQAEDAKIKTEAAELEEQVKLAVMASYGEDGKIDIEKLNKNLEEVKGYEVEEGKEITKLPATVTVGEDKLLISNTGTVTSITTTVAEAKTAGTIFDKETTIYDEYGNKVVIPEGFKIASDSAEQVAGGIVIEDATYTNTKGSQFVWIPVGTVTGTVNGIEKTETIDLGRYEFILNSDGTVTTISYTGDYVEENIKPFENSTNNNGGYYFGRYEAGLTGDYEFDEDDSRTWVGTNMNMVCKSGEQVYNYITQLQASELSKNMYTSATFTSDLINSYAWDTAIVFIQKFGEESNSSTYSMQSGISAIDTSQPQATGKNMLNETSTVDKQINIFDMAGNCHEWTTEVSNDSYCVGRGGHCGYYGDTTKWRNALNTTLSSNVYTFRPILYL